MEKILVVDDEPEVCRMLEIFLGKKGYQVFRAFDGKTALELVKEERPHIVLLDIKMPGMDGIECLKKIVEIDKELGVIMITAVKKEETGKEALELGAYDYITKPLDLHYLEECLKWKIFQITASGDRTVTPHM